MVEAVVTLEDRYLATLSALRTTLELISVPNTPDVEAKLKSDMSSAIARLDATARALVVAQNAATDTAAAVTIATLNTAASSAIGALQTSFNAIGHTLANLTEGLSQTLVSNSQQTAATAIQIVGDTSAYIASMLRGVGSSLDTAIGSIEDLVNSTVAIQLNGLTGLTDNLNRSLAAALAEMSVVIGARLADIEYDLSVQVGESVSATGRLVDQIVRQVTGLIATSTISSQQVVDRLAGAEDYGTLVLGGGFSGLVTALTQALSPQPKPLLLQLVDLIRDIFSPSSAEAAPVHPLPPLPAINPAQGVSGRIESLLDYSKNALTGPMWARVIAGGFIAALAPIEIIRTLAGEVAERERVAWTRTGPWRGPTPGDALIARIKEIISHQEFREAYADAGFTPDTADTSLLAAMNVPDPERLLSWRHRGIISDEELDIALRRSGWEEQDRRALREASFLIPPIQDLITMAVREAFSPDVAASFGQYEDFPETVVPHVEAQGLSREWAERYWASHWSLPSPTQGFEMFQRGVIDRGTLELLLRALDIMPYWRDKLIQINYNPLTRVDIRRMFSVGVLSKAEVESAYLDAGYSPVNARRLADFVELVETKPETPEKVKQRDLTVAALMDLYHDRILDAEGVADRLMLLGFDNDEVNLMRANVDLRLALDRRKAGKEAILAKFRALQITSTQAVDEANKIGLTPVELEILLADIQRIQTARVQTPSRTDLDRFVKAKLIDPVEYVDAMGRLGYNQVWANIYLRAATGGV